MARKRSATKNDSLRASKSVEEAGTSSRFFSTNPSMAYLTLKVEKKRNMRRMGMLH